MSDIVFTEPISHPAWPKEMFELLLISLVFPFVRDDSWQLQETTKIHLLEW
jgi:hypothetical protein